MRARIVHNNFEMNVRWLRHVHTETSLPYSVGIHEAVASDILACLIAHRSHFKSLTYCTWQRDQRGSRVGSHMIFFCKTELHEVFGLIILYFGGSWTLAHWKYLECQASPKREEPFVSFFESSCDKLRVIRDPISSVKPRNLLAIASANSLQKPPAIRASVPLPLHFAASVAWAPPILSTKWRGAIFFMTEEVTKLAIFMTFLRT